MKEYYKCESMFIIWFGLFHVESNGLILMSFDIMIVWTYANNTGLTPGVKRLKFSNNIQRNNHPEILKVFT